MNKILQTDSYKVTHWKMLPDDTEGIFSYFESRVGAKYPSTVFFGLQAVLKEFLCHQYTLEEVEEAEEVFNFHFGSNVFNKRGWLDIINKYDGYLPIRIRAVPEGLPIPTSNVLMTVNNTDSRFGWLTNYVESKLTHIWYPSTVATLSFHVKQAIVEALEETTDLSSDEVEATASFMLHDFGYRGVSSEESASMGGLAHLVNFKGTDTLSAILAGKKYYNHYPEAFSVPATEHSIMTSRGEHGEENLVNELLDKFPNGILSLVGDSFNIERFVGSYLVKLRDKIVARNGKVVARPDSLRSKDDTPENQMQALTSVLAASFGGVPNSKGKFVLNNKVGLLWGDGIGPEGIEKILKKVGKHYSVEHLVFGMGGGLLQKVNRDTQRFAFKCSARHDGEKWLDIQKNPLDSSKKSKPGILTLVYDGGYETVKVNYEDLGNIEGEVMRDVYFNGRLLIDMDFSEVRRNAQTQIPDLRFAGSEALVS